MSAATDLATGATEHEQHEADDEDHDSGRPQDADTENQAEQQKDEAENNHVERGTHSLAVQNMQVGALKDASGCFRVS